MKMPKLGAVLKALPDVLSSGYRRIVPSAEDDIVEAIMRNVPEMEEATYGFTLNPRSGRMLEAGNDFGYMMADVPEQPVNRMAAALEGEKLNLDRAALERMIRDPYFMDELRRGAYLGGWYDAPNQQFVIDPARRFMNKDASVVAGMNADQMAGFDLRNTAQYDLEPKMRYAFLNDDAREAAYEEALRSMLLRDITAKALGAGAAGAGVAGLLAGRD